MATINSAGISVVGFQALGSSGAMSGRTLTGSLTVSITNGNGSGNPVFEVDGGGYGWGNVIGTSQTAFARRAFFANNAELVTFTLNSAANLGDCVRIVGKGAGGWKLAQPNASSQIIFGSSATTVGTGGYLQSTHQNDCVELVAFDTNVWYVTSYIGTITVA